MRPLLAAVLCGGRQGSSERVIMQLVVVISLCLLYSSESAYTDCGCSASRSPDVSQAKSFRDSSTHEGGESDDVGFCSADTQNFNEERSCVISETGGKESTLSKTLSLSREENMPMKKGMVFVEGGEFLMGTDKPGILIDGEHPARRKHIKSFWLDETEVSNEAFAAFVNETGHKTEAEVYGDSFVISSSVKHPEASRGAALSAPWWWNVVNTTWRSPEGPGSDILTRPNYPVVHISWNDAKAFCAWKKCRLPSEAEWEFACKKALNGTAFPWGDDSEGAEEQSSSNIWQGVFPDTNTMADGHVFTAPVDAYDYMKGLRVKNMIGNVWEWTEDVWSTKHADNGRHEDPALADGNHRVKKGGSFMCHASYCFRYRCEARSQNTPDTSAANIGFRCAADVE